MAPKTRVLVLCSRGVTHQDRHLMLDMRKLIPHSKKECKFDKKDTLTALNELSIIDNCDKCIYFENRKGKLLFMWASNVTGGPTVKFLVQGVHTMSDLKFVGNCLKGSRPILTFDSNFDKLPHLQLIKELFIQIFNVPFKHPKSQPFVDRVVTFSYLDNHIWFRNYQIIDEAEISLAEIGPRMILLPLLALSSSFHGRILWASYKKNVKAVLPIKNKKVKETKPQVAPGDYDEDNDVDEDEMDEDEEAASSSDAKQAESDDASEVDDDSDS
ncbi:Ribosome biogenesis protein BRX1-like protein, partial [Fragariocoptes setiger]